MSTPVILLGNYAESHGVIGNDMYDDTSKEDFKLDLGYKYDANPRWWKHVEPIWITALKQVRLKTKIFKLLLL